MPELPEVETVRRGLDRDLVGRRIVAVEVGRERTVRRTSKEELIARLLGHTVIDARRTGKHLLSSLDSGDALIIHLRMSGQIRFAAPDEPRPAHCHVVLSLSMNDHVSRADEPIAPVTPLMTELRFIDPRTFGEVIAYDPRALPMVVPELSRLGPDPIVDGLDGRILLRTFAGTRRPIKAVLLDQHVIAGIGNIYADEILHRARIDPATPAAELGARRVGRLVRSIMEVLSEAIDMGGSTLPDTQYLDTAGNTGSFQTRHSVYGRSGDLCTTCGRAHISSRRVAGRTTCWCPRCQR